MTATNDARTRRPSLSTIATSFLSEDPDAVGLLNSFRAMAASAIVLTETVTKGEDGKTTGTILCPGVGAEIHFAISGSQYTVEMRSLDVLQEEFSDRTVAFSFTDTGGVAEKCTATVRFKPKPGADFMKYQTGHTKELPIEWALQVTPTGITSRPRATISRGEGEREGMYLVRDPVGISASTEDSPGTMTSFDPWLQMLRPIGR